ncbi:uncharacterized protein I303_107944 [Kwoniella dejecticola CBS 10117]|uniref:Uncharacterized protein n=1 Tax=Kwoniella dejecticola CBS 10117 TaxID=1296121 RepID=A0A1A5ZW37_9TREE|nr:uncharacterized protein I303_07937 [Kwoniella dejecticola CBS 10117]OBR82023.1 hypothetical protein I303_07937 [Kwoniella dejecticola CBS 10117]
MSSEQSRPGCPSVVDTENSSFAKMLGSQSKMKARREHQKDSVASSAGGAQGTADSAQGTETPNPEETQRQLDEQLGVNPETTTTTTSSNR